MDGLSNVVVNVCFENATADAADDIMEGSMPNAVVQYTTYSNYVSGATAGCSLNASSISLSRANMTFGYSTTATLIETAATATSTKHIAIGSNDYLYSNNSKLLMRLGSVNASLGCVTSSLDAGGTAWVSYQGGERSAKVLPLRLLPILARLIIQSHYTLIIPNWMERPPAALELQKQLLHQPLRPHLPIP
ncbi:MAG: hypothetical protein WDO71_18605 [Bacteroidota bacterium]